MITTKLANVRDALTSQESTASLGAFGRLIVANLAFLPAVILTVIFLGYGNVFVFLALQPTLILGILGIIAGLVLSKLGRRGLLLLTVNGFAYRALALGRDNRTRNRTIVLFAGLLAVVPVTLLGGGPLWAIPASWFAFLVNWAFSGGKPAKSFGHRLRTNVADALIDYFTSNAKLGDLPANKEYKARLALAKRHITKVEQDDNGSWLVHIRNNVKGKSDDDLTRLLKSVGSQLGLYDLDLVDLDKRQGFVTVRMWLSEPEDATTEIRPYPLWEPVEADKAPTLTERVLSVVEGTNGCLEQYKPVPVTPKALPFGVLEDGSLATLAVEEANLLLAGQPGQGKSATLNAVLSSLAFIPNLALVGIDPNLAGLGLWKDRLSASTQDEESIPLVLLGLFEEMKRRLVIMEDRGIKKITPDMWEEFPQIVTAIDEAAAAFDQEGKPPQQTMAYKLTKNIIARGRAAGFSVIIATQRPSADLVPTSLRSLINQLIAHKVARESDAVMVLGELAQQLAHKLTSRQRGVGYMKNITSADQMKFRSALVMSNEERERTLMTETPGSELYQVATSAPTIEEIVSATAHLTPQLKFLDDNRALQEHFAEVQADKARILAELDRL